MKRLIKSSVWLLALVLILTIFVNQGMAAAELDFTSVSYIGSGETTTALIHGTSGSTHPMLMTLVLTNVRDPNDDYPYLVTNISWSGDNWTIPLDITNLAEGVYKVRVTGGYPPPQPPISDESDCTPASCPECLQAVCPGGGGSDIEEIGG